MNRILFVCFCVVLVGLTGCGRDKVLVRPDRLAPGNGDPGRGGSGVYMRPALDIVIRIAEDATNFTPGDLMSLFVNSVDHTDEIVIGGKYAILTLDPSPTGANFVELIRPNGVLVDTFTYNADPQPLPTITAVSSTTAMRGDQVTVSGTLLTATAVRVFFGGFEGTVDASSDSSITATVPDDAIPGLIFVLVDGVAAEGLVGLTVVDDEGTRIPQPSSAHVFAVFPAAGVIETPVRICGINFDSSAHGVYNAEAGQRLLDVKAVDVPDFGPVTEAFGVVGLNSSPGSAGFELRPQSGSLSNNLPFVVNG
ncbi:MAG: IPT/TIG domain-containing protein [Planctomycetota bacterium]